MAVNAASQYLTRFNGLTNSLLCNWVLNLNWIIKTSSFQTECWNVTCLNPQGIPGVDGLPGESGIVGNPVRFLTFTLLTSRVNINVTVKIVNSFLTSWKPENSSVCSWFILIISLLSVSWLSVCRRYIILCDQSDSFNLKPIVWVWLKLESFVFLCLKWNMTV